jgi:hypothetical protein
VPDIGLGRDLMAMLEWCRQRVAADGWAYHGHTTRQRGEQPSISRAFTSQTPHTRRRSRGGGGACDGQPLALMELRTGESVTR